MTPLMFLGGPTCHVLSPYLPKEKKAGEGGTTVRRRQPAWYGVGVGVGDRRPSIAVPSFVGGSWDVEQ
jgi:hypothetical protein